MIKIRDGNSHTHVWAVTWNGVPEDFSDATEINLITTVYGKKINLVQDVDYKIEGNLFIVDFTPKICTVIGVYNLILNYAKPSGSFISGERRSAKDVDVIEIVARSKDADPPSTTSTDSELLVGIRGDDAYEVAKADGFVGTRSQWLFSLIGNSAYEEWLERGGTGTFDDFLEELKGDKGDTGDKGDAGYTPVITNNYWYINGVNTGIKALGEDGLQIELQTTTTYIQWRVQGGVWSNLIALSDLKGEKGDTGDKGDKGDAGDKGDIGIGVPIGGVTGQQLMKKSNVDYDFEWQTPAGTGDMLKSEYDSDGNGIVDNAEKVSGFTVGTNVPANAKFTDTVYTHPETHPASIILQNESNRFVSDAEKLAWNDKVNNSRVLTDVPANAKFTDTIYTHPTSHPYSMITGAPTSLPANGGDSATVNGKTVEENVPANAKFTDTTYSEITEAEINTGTASTLRTITARRVTFILSKVSTLISNAISALTKSDVGLGNVDNTSDANKPVSTAMQTALNGKLDANKMQVVTELPASPATGVFYFVKE